ncbi:hypothetical protein D3C81_2298510 [compost metagenome]
MLEQTAFGIMLEALGGFVGQDHAGQLAGLVLIFGGFAGCVDELGQLPQRVVFPLRGLA